VLVLYLQSCACDANATMAGEQCRYGGGSVGSGSRWATPPNFRCWSRTTGARPRDGLAWSAADLQVVDFG
jgi:hypothetical protein